MESLVDLLRFPAASIELTGTMVSVGLFVLFLGLLYWYSVSPFSELERIGIKHPKPSPFVGNMFLFQKGFFEGHQELVQKYGRVCGYYFGRRPTILIAEPEMLKQILVKDFSNFVNRMKVSFSSKPMGDSLLFLQDGDWKNVRNVLTPTFSSAKMREMCPLINQAADMLMENLETHADSGKGFDIHRYYGCFSMDVIASVAFGTQVDSQKNPEDPFVKHAKMIFKINFFKPLIFLSIIFPSIMMPIRHLMPLTSMSKVNAFFVRVIKDIIAQRNQQPSDQTTPDYNNVQNLPYLDMVISEVLRLYPPGVRFGRVCEKDCLVNGQLIPAGMTLEVPVGVLHYDPKYWPEPEKFKPERFTPEMKAERHPYVYLPFGAGPRSCIGMRLALLEAKIALVRILSKYSFQTCPETQIPVQITSAGTLGPKEGVILKIVPRKS
ncbi:thromboxane-A synthase isoform X2 [Heterodontus francisci]|uniref:thromboxane-A synthase isoform X2 n=1 Tax=Heterodontus francisci TaxID=7792 RepID=UPI00355C88E4